MVEVEKFLNAYSSSVLTVEKDMKTGELGTINESVLRTVTIMVKEVLNGLRHLKGDKPPGPDQIYLKTLWEAREEIAGTLALIYQSSLDTGEVLEIGDRCNF